MRLFGTKKSINTSAATAMEIKMLRRKIEEQRDINRKLCRDIEEQASIIRALQDSRTMLQQVVRQLVADSINDK